MSPLAPPTACVFDDPGLIAAVFAWLDREIETGRAAATVSVPDLGSREWLALPDGEPAKWAAVFRAARAWYREVTTIGERTRSEARELLALFEAYALERDRADYASLREAAEQAARGIERRERQAARTASLPDRTGPELIAAAHASWGLPAPIQMPNDAHERAA